ncbi:DNA topoisomerase 3 [Lactobacillus helveticus]|nr:DNA topoisomerase 3 [Lactobacillus helveticus]
MALENNALANNVKITKLKYGHTKCYLLHGTSKSLLIDTDSDREGENIAWSIMNQAKINLKQKTIKRLWINSLEKDAIRSGFKALKDGWAFYPKYQEAQTRQISDWLIGMIIYFVIKTKWGTRGILNWSRADANLVYGLSKGPGNQKL